jgi:hypothetical protein
VVQIATRDWHGGDRSGGGALCNFYDIGNGEVLMTSSQSIAQTVPEASGPTAVPMRFEVTTMPVADVDRANMSPGSLQGVILVVENIETARDDLIRRGVDVSEIWHIEPGQGRLPGIDPQRRSYFSRATFADPDGNTWQLQEITERLPGRV